MAKRYNEHVSVYKPKDRPPFFVWKGERCDVTRILHHWTQINQWWKPEQEQPELFQVAARPFREVSTVTCELRYDRRGKAWRLESSFYICLGFG